MFTFCSLFPFFSEGITKGPATPSLGHEEPSVSSYRERNKVGDEVRGLDKLFAPAKLARSYHARVTAVDTYPPAPPGALVSRTCDLCM